jgi:hypothetical protein
MLAPKVPAVIQEPMVQVEQVVLLVLLETQELKETPVTQARTVQAVQEAPLELPETQELKETPVTQVRMGQAVLVELAVMLETQELKETPVTQARTVQAVLLELEELVEMEEVVEHLPIPARLALAEQPVILAAKLVVQEAEFLAAPVEPEVVLAVETGVQAVVVHPSKALLLVAAPEVAVEEVQV